jgi:hypothetical protein
MLLGVAACAPRTFALYVPRPLDQYASVRTEGDLTIAVECVNTPDDMDRYFGQNLSNAGVMPIAVIAANHGGDASFILTTDGISLRAVGDSVEERAAPGSVAPDRGGHVVATTGAILGAVGVVVTGPAAFLVTPIMMGVAGGMIARSNAARHNLLAKEFRSDTLAPGRSVHGFVYFPLERVRHDRRQWHLDIKATEFPGARVASFEFPIDCKGGAP